MTRNYDLIDSLFNQINGLDGEVTSDPQWHRDGASDVSFDDTGEGLEGWLAAIAGWDMPGSLTTGNVGGHRYFLTMTARAHAGQKPRTVAGIEVDGAVVIYGADK